MAEYPIHPYIIHCLEPLLANAAAPVVLALDGRCGSGKTTMAAALAEQFPDSIVLHTDDFYLPPADRVPGWEQTPCANMDFARLRDEVLAPARAGKPVLYRAYSCREGAYLPVQQLAAQPLVILEGSYSHHPLLAPYEGFPGVHDLLGCRADPPPAGPGGRPLPGLCRPVDPAGRSLFHPAQH